MNSTTQKIYIKGALTPSQRSTVDAAAKWIERICDRKATLPPLFMDNTDPSPIAKKLRAMLNAKDESEHQGDYLGIVPDERWAPMRYKEFQENAKSAGTDASEKTL